MTKPIFALGVNLETFDINEAVGFPKIDYWILVVNFPQSQEYILILPHQLREALGLIEREKDLDLYLLYQGFKDSSPDGRFQIKVNFLNFNDLEEFIGPHR